MNLKNNQITMKEVLENPAAQAMFQKRFPRVMNHPFAVPAQKLTLAQTMEFARIYLPETAINEILRELQKL